MNVLPDLIGTTIDGYHLDERIGVGGMGMVYRASHPQKGDHLAIKVLPRVLAEDREHLKRFQREGQTVSALNHPHIIPIYDYGVDDGLSYIVMPLLTGGSLEDWMGGTDHLPPLEETARLLKVMGDALDFAHSHGVIHRDMKPSNVMFDDTGKLYIVDFGVAKVTHATSTLTGTGTAIGTPAFMAPEQWSAKPATAKTDQYAVGAMAYMLATGKLPFEAETPIGLMYLHLHEYPEPPHRIRNGLPMDLGAVLNVAMSKNPKDRFPSVTEFAENFERVVRDGSLSAKLPSKILVSPIASKVGVTNEVGTMQLPPDAISDELPVTEMQKTMLEGKKRRLPLRMMVGTAAILLMIVGGFFMFSGGDNASEPPSDGNRALAAGNATETLTPTAIFGPTGTPTTAPSDTPAPTSTNTLEPSPTAGVTQVAEAVDESVMYELVEMVSALGVYEEPDNPFARIFAAAYESRFAPFVAGYWYDEDDDVWLYIYYFDQGEPSDGWSLAEELDLDAEEINLLDEIDPENPPEMPELPYNVRAERPYGVIYEPTATLPSDSGGSGGGGNPPPTDIPGQPTHTPDNRAPELQVVGARCESNSSDGTSTGVYAIFDVKNVGGSMQSPSVWRISTSNGSTWQGLIQLEANGQRLLRGGPSSGTFSLFITGFGQLGSITCEPSVTSIPPDASEPAGENQDG